MGLLTTWLHIHVNGVFESLIHMEPENRMVVAKEEKEGEDFRCPW